MRHFLDRKSPSLQTGPRKPKLEDGFAFGFKKIDAELVLSGRQFRRTAQFQQTMVAVVVDDELIIDIQLATVVGFQIESVLPG